MTRYVVRSGRRWAQRGAECGDSRLPDGQDVRQCAGIRARNRRGPDLDRGALVAVLVDHPAQYPADHIAGLHASCGGVSDPGYRQPEVGRGVQPASDRDVRRVGYRDHAGGAAAVGGRAVGRSGGPGNE
jgi:hypothetical protein